MGTDVWLSDPDEKFTDNQKWTVVRLGNEIQLQSYGTKLCLSFYAEKTAHLWDCSSPYTRLTYDTASKQLRAGNNPQRCFAGAAKGEVVLGACESKWDLPESEGSLTVGGLVATVCGTASTTSVGIGWFTVKTPDADFNHKGVNGTVLMHTFKDGVAMRISLKRLPGHSSYTAVPIAQPCADIWDAPASAQPSSAGSVQIGGQGFAAAMAWLSLQRRVAGVLLKAGNELIACAPVYEIPHTQLVEDGSEADLYALGKHLFEQHGASQGAGDEGTFIRMKEDATRWLPGMDRAIAKVQQEKIVLSAVCKNTAGAIPTLRSNLEETGKRFKDYRVIVYENNSGDNTGGAIKAWAAQNPKVIAISENVNYQCHREQCIARARNQVLTALTNDASLQDFNFFLFVDCDFHGGFRSDAVVSSFVRDDWDVACSNGVAGVAPHFYYWDRYAYREDRWPILQWRWFTDMRAVMLYDPGDAWVPCHSCFGGFSVYRRSAVGPCYFNATDPINVVDCEHVSFCTCIRQRGGRIFVNPGGFLRYPVMAYTP